MKKISLFFVAVISVIFFIVGCLKNSNSPAASQVDKRAILNSINLSDSSDKGYGVSGGDGIYFVRCDLIEEQYGDIDLVVLEVNPDSLTADGKIFEGFYNRETIKMYKVGKYFIGKPAKKYLNPAFYFRTGIGYFPTSNPEKFQSKDFVFNQYGGILLNL